MRLTRRNGDATAARTVWAAAGTGRSQLGKQPGDVVAVTLELDQAERTVEVPEDLRAALEEAGLLGAFQALSYSHQREHVGWIDEAVKADTRARRISQTVARVKG